MRGGRQFRLEPPDERLRLRLRAEVCARVVFRRGRRQIRGFRIKAVQYHAGRVGGEGAVEVDAVGIGFVGVQVRVRFRIGDDIEVLVADSGGAPQRRLEAVGVADGHHADLFVFQQREGFAVACVVVVDQSAGEFKQVDRVARLAGVHARGKQDVFGASADFQRIHLPPVDRGSDLIEADDVAFSQSEHDLFQSGIMVELVEADIDGPVRRVRVFFNRGVSGVEKRLRHPFGIDFYAAQQRRRPGGRGRGGGEAPEHLGRDRFIRFDFVKIVIAACECRVDESGAGNGFDFTIRPVRACRAVHLVAARARDGGPVEVDARGGASRGIQFRGRLRHHADGAVRLFAVAVERLAG
ncbi:MAG: hypothetical protein BWY37_02175 [Firmicutes bacterium ADurb.Bin262]|nr:MAG: hypothetical protein BWY37_02175 [Firmicutes bacterium ADurb.Bin262]